MDRVFSVRLPEELVTRLDASLRLGQRRNRAIREALEQALGNETQSPSPAGRLGAIEADGAPVRSGSAALPGASLSPTPVKKDLLAQVAEDLAREGVERPSEAPRTNRPPKDEYVLPKIAPRRQF